MCGCEALPSYKRPPDGSYTTSARQLRIGETVTSIRGAAVTPGFFRGAEVRPLLGRLITEGDQASGTHRVVVLSHDLWTERFASSPSVVGQQIEIDGHPFTIVGVVPPGFSFPEGARLWTMKDTGGR